MKEKKLDKDINVRGKELTDEEVVKALECCSGGITGETCKNCPLNLSNSGVEACYYDDTILEKYALDLINRQKAEIERLTEEKEDLYFQNKNLQTYIDNHEPIWERNKEQAVKDTAKEILDEVSKHYGGAWLVELYKRYGV